MKALRCLFCLLATLQSMGCSSGYNKAGTVDNTLIDATASAATTGIVQSAGTAAAAANGNMPKTDGSSSPTVGAASTLAPITDPGGALPSDGALDFGENVAIFDPSMSMPTIQAKISAIFQTQETSQFGSNRTAYFFKPGAYQLDVQVGFYMTVLGLGQSPDDVLITGGVRTTAAWNSGNATTNFWRGVENLSIVPQQNAGTMIWAVAQATALRRLHIKGPINLWDSNFPSPNWSSGGFIADTKIDGTITSGSQQQFLMRNNALTQWQGGVWNMVFVGNVGAPAEIWPLPPYTVIATTPSVREKPYLTFDSNSSSYAVVVPPLRATSQGITWAAAPVPAVAPANLIDIKDFYVAHADKDTAESLTIAILRGKHLMLTPGIYHLTRAIEVSRANTIVMGLGMATLMPDKGTAAITVDDVDNVTISGLILDAGPIESPTLMELGSSKTTVRHDSAPTALFDVSCRVGGATAGTTQTCVIININNVFLDNVWLWRADHGNGVGWTVNPATHGWWSMATM